LPAFEKPSVGPFVFFDHMGPAASPPGKGINVRPHPHIGLATLTYLFEGEILHRDSLGFVQPIQPGAVNLMTAGRGIVHSERTSAERLTRGQRLNGIQIWMALPDGQEEVEPAFVHYPAGALPTFIGDGVAGTVVVGRAFGVTSPVVTASRTLYVDAAIDEGCTWRVPRSETELAAYVVAGAVRVADCQVPMGTMAVLRDATDVVATTGSRVVLIGGEPLGRRHLWWNFVSSSQDRIDAAGRDWEEGRFPPVPGDDERIPLPVRAR
jgi:redox-sensitive bicupin YhaK (pirin superfamily)